MSWMKLHHFPLLMVFWFLLTAMITYVWSVLKADIKPVFPFIGDLGTFPPTSCIFSQMGNLGAIMMAGIIYVRYLQVKQCYLEHERHSKLNTVSLYLGLVGPLGFSVVFNFQESNLIMIHLIGTHMAFGFSSIYQLLMCKISFNLSKISCSTNLINCSRLFIGIITAVSCIAFDTLFIIGNVWYKGDLTKWRLNGSSSDFFLISAIIEWTSAASTLLYLSTFYADFKYAQLNEPIVEVMKE